MRLAYFSPLNPVQSGISDYSEELLPYLARGAEIDVYIDRYKPANPALGPGVTVLPARTFDRAAGRRPYDSVVYQMGNSPAHAYIYARLLRTPGVLVLHEFVLHHLRMWMALNRGRGNRYLATMAATYGAAGRAAAERVLLGQHPEALFEFPLVEEALERAAGVIVHSRYMADQVQRVRPGVPLAVVNMGVPLPPYVPESEARARLGIDPDVFVLASIGHLNPYKRLNVALRAFKAFSLRRPRSLFLLVGSRSPNYDVDRMIGMLGLGDRVRVVGYAPPPAFADYLAAADVCINLRYPTAGETSAALLRIMGGGKPVLVSRVGSFTELPDAAAGKVDVGDIEEELLLAYLEFLAARPDLRAAMGRAARRYVGTQHTLEGAAQGYLTFLAGLQGRPAPTIDLTPPPYVEPPHASPSFPAVPALVPVAPPEEASPALPPEEPATPTAVFAEAAAACLLDPDDPALAPLVRHLTGLL